MLNKLQIVVEQHPDGFVAYPLGVQGVIVGQGDTKEAALEDVQSAIQFHVETFGEAILQNADPILNAFLIETVVANVG